MPAADRRVRPLAYALPRGIASMEEWGQTVIGFGKFGGKKMTYYALATWSPMKLAAIPTE